MKYQPDEWIKKLFNNIYIYILLTSNMCRDSTIIF